MSDSATVLSEFQIRALIIRLEASAKAARCRGERKRAADAEWKARDYRAQLAILIAPRIVP